MSLLMVINKTNIIKVFKYYLANHETTKTSKPLMRLIKLGVDLFEKLFWSHVIPSLQLKHWKSFSHSVIQLPNKLFLAVCRVGLHFSLS